MRGTFPERQATPFLPANTLPSPTVHPRVPRVTEKPPATLLSEALYEWSSELWWNSVFPVSHSSPQQPEPHRLVRRRHLSQGPARGSLGASSLVLWGVHQSVYDSACPVTKQRDTGSLLEHGELSQEVAARPRGDRSALIYCAFLHVAHEPGRPPYHVDCLRHSVPVAVPEALAVMSRQAFTNLWSGHDLKTLWVLGLVLKTAAHLNRPV